MVVYSPILNRFTYPNPNPKQPLTALKKVPNTLAEEAYSDGGNTIFYGVSDRELRLNGNTMVGVPFLSKLPYDDIVSPLLRPEEEEEA